MKNINTKNKNNESRNSVKLTRKKIIETTELTKNQLHAERNKFENAIMSDEFYHDPHTKKTNKNT